MAHGAPSLAGAETLADAAAIDPAEAKRRARVFPLVLALFFAFGFCTVLVDTLIPKLKAVFALSYVEVMLTQFCFFFAYFVVSIPAGWLMTRVGYLRGVVVGLVIMAAGCLLFTPAASAGLYPAFLGALFILASGITIVQVAANPLAAALGDPRTSSSRLTLAQAFNSVGTTIGPYFGSVLILAGGVTAAPAAGSVSAAALAVFRQKEAHAVQLPFLIIAAAIVLLAVVCWIARKAPAPHVEQASSGGWSRLLARPRLVLGAVSIFAYVGAEVSIGSSIVNLLISNHTLSLSAETAGKLVAVYWGLAMIGRFGGSYILRKISPALVLTTVAAAAALLAGGSTMMAGMVAAVAILSIGLFNAIMFPTIFTLATEDLGLDAARGSGFLCLAIVGGAIVPLITGFAADHIGLGNALIVPAVCYVWIAAYGLLSKSGALDRNVTPLAA